MGLFSGDVIIKTAVELAVEDILKNPWVIDDIFSEFVENPMLKQKFGQKEINRAKEFLLNNKINFYMRHRIDNMEFPAVTIAMGNSQEDKSLATLGDASVCIEDLDPCEINKPISYIVKPFNYISYDKSTGFVEISQDLEGLDCIQPQMLAIDPETGDAYIIQSIDTNGFFLEKDLNIEADQLAIIPRYQMYRARRERIISQETYNIGCHTHGDPSTLIFLYCLVKYSLLRYREGLLEFNSFQLSNIEVTDMVKNDAFGQDNVYSRFIILSGQAQEDWIKSPYRIIEKVDLVDSSDTLGEGIGIRICSNEETVEGSQESLNDLWKTIKN